MLIFVALLGSIFAGSANANVIGFDFGSNFFKVVLVKPANPFQIVENITSKRKTESYLTIGPEDRKFGADAFNSATKLPKTTFAQSAALLAQEYDPAFVEQMREHSFVMNDFVEDDRGLMAYQMFTIKEGDDDTNSSGEKTIYYTEDIVAQVLGYGKFLAEK